MNSDIIHVSRVTKLPLLDSDGATIGRIADVVLVPVHQAPPRVVGFVGGIQRRRIFINVGRVEEIGSRGLRLRGGVLDLRHFEKRSGESLANEDLLNRRLGTRLIVDLSLRPVDAKPPTWEIGAVALGSPGRFRSKRSRHLVDWREILPLFDNSPVIREVASLRDMHPSDVAKLVRSLPMAKRHQLAEAMEDERLADLLEELPEDEQVKMVEKLDIERLAYIIGEMDPDDAVDLLAEMPADQRIALLASMDPDEARPLRRLLLYDNNTAGGLMTSEPAIVSPDATVAEALARLREYELPPVLAAQIFVVRPPTKTPTGAFLGVIGIQRLLREMPSSTVSQCLGDEPEFVTPELPDGDVARTLAQYDLLAIAVVDDGGRLLGAVTVDDILDHILPVDWRRGR